MLQKHGATLVLDESKESVMVDEVLVFKARMDEHVRDAFSGSDLFAQTVKDAFESFINRRANKPAELIGTRLVHLVDIPADL